MEAEPTLPEVKEMKFPPSLFTSVFSCSPEALRRSNLALRQRCEEMEGWQRRTREERDFLSCRFQEARALVERLAQENHSLQGLVNGPASSSASRCSSSQTEDLQGRPSKNGALDGVQVWRTCSPRDGTRRFYSSSDSDLASCLDFRSSGKEES